MSDDQSPTDAGPSLAARLAAAKARKAAAVEQLDADADLRAVERAEQEAENAEAIAKAVKDYGAVGVKIAVVPAPGSKIVIVQRCHPAVFKKFSENETVTFEENEKLVRPCVVYPTARDFDTLAGEAPGVVNTAALRICELMGVRKTELASK